MQHISTSLYWLTRGDPKGIKIPLLGPPFLILQRKTTNSCIGSICHCYSVVYLYKISEYNCSKEIRAHIGKANATCGKLEKIWKSNGCGIRTKIRLYEAVVLSTLLYGSETWSMTVVNGRKLDATHNK